MQMLLILFFLQHLQYGFDFLMFLNKCLFTFFLLPLPSIELFHRLSLEISNSSLRYFHSLWLWFFFIIWFLWYLTRPKRVHIAKANSIVWCDFQFEIAKTGCAAVLVTAELWLFFAAAKTFALLSMRVIRELLRVRVLIFHFIKSLKGWKKKFYFIFQPSAQLK